MEQQIEQKKEVKNGMSAKTMVMGLIIIALLGVLIWVIISGREAPAPVVVNNTAGIQSKIILGNSSKSIDELLAEAQREVAEGSIGIKMNPTISVESGTTTAKGLIENPARNKKSMMVTLNLADTEEEIFKSGLLPPESYMNEFELNRVLEKGSYLVTAIFQTYTSEGVLEEGQAAIEVTIVVS